MSWRAWAPRVAVATVSMAATVGLVVVWAMSRPTLVERPAPVPGLLRIADVTVIDVVEGRAVPHQDVGVLGENIVSVGVHVDSPDTPAERTIDGTGLTLVPGYIDAHCHVGSSPAVPWTTSLPDLDLNLERLLFAGVTRVFDPGSMVPDTFEIRAELASGARLGPVLHAAGPIFTAVGGHPEPMARELYPGVVVDQLLPKMMRQIDSPDAARDAVAALVPHRPDFIKLVVDRLPLHAPRLTPQLSRAIVEEAKAQGFRAVAHIGSTEDALEAADAGVSAWIHGVYKERIPDEAISTLAAHGIPMVPTLVVFRTYGEMAQGAFPATPMEQALAPASLLDPRGDTTGQDGVSDDIRDYVTMLSEQQQSALDNVGRLHRAGVVMITGSDAQGGVVHGASLHRELDLLSQAGLSPLDVLRAATLNGARFLSNQADPPYGVVAEGKRADLVLLRADPLQDVGALSEIESVWLGGVPLAREPWPRP